MDRWTWISHSILLRETFFEGFIVNVEPLRVGLGEELRPGAPLNLALLRINYNGISVPYIPGSSLKGVFRSYATSLAKRSGLDVCNGLSKEACGEIKFVNGKRLDDYVDELMRKGESENAVKAFHENACLICKIFGSTRYMSNASFSDAYPIDEGGNVINVKTNVRVGIAINRRTGSVLRRGRYGVEFIEAGARFRFNIRCRNLPNYAIGLLSLILKRMNEGLVKIGGFKSRGFGAVKIESLRFRSRDFVKESSLVMASLEPEGDVEVSLAGVAELKDGWLTSEGEKAWKTLAELIEVWKICQERLKS
ncbi:MAG: CRISPR-associated RAMP protein Csx7 [Candidatus Nezhaarchaeales archaeon]